MEHRQSNRYFARNFDNHHDDFRGDRQKETSSIIPDDSFSNTMYDRNRGVSLFHVPSPNIEGDYRIISDVEIVMSSDPSVTCYFSDQHRQSIMNAIQGAPRAAPSRSMTDDELIEYCVPNDLERDEVTDHVRRCMNKIDGDIKDGIKQDEFDQKYGNRGNVGSTETNESTTE